MHKFDKSKRYKFSKNIYLTKPGRATRYKNSPSCREWVDEADGQEVTIIDELEGRVEGGADGYSVAAEWCEELPSMGYFRGLCIQVMDKLYKGKEEGEVI